MVVIRSMALLASLSLPAAATEAIDWAYHGQFGPDHWSQINSAYGLCGDGVQQSPVDIIDAFDTYLEPPEIHWQMDGWQAEHSGRTLVLHNENGGTATHDGMDYALIQVHFHAKSEHAFDGEHFPMEVQFMHRDGAGNFLIIAQMLRGGGRHDQMNAILAAMPEKKGQAKPLDPIDLSHLVSDLDDAYRYEGSLTIPPCAETVTWLVVPDPVVISEEALLAFSSFFPDSRRPLQPMNRRIVLTD